MMSEKKVPAIRFRGFEDDWEQRKVGDITIESTEYTTLDAGYPLLTSSRAGLMYQNEYRGNLTTDSKETLFSVVPIGACTYRHMSDDDVFHLNINTLEKGLVSREYPVFFATKENCLNFIIQYINSSASFRAFCAEQKKGGTRTRLYYNALCEFKMMVPSKREQEVIAGYLLSLDHLITLHQCKLEKLKIVKKSMLVNCFPKNGEKVPKFRFSGFTGDWEQRKLGDIVERITRKNENLESILPLTISAQDGLIDQNEFFDKRIASKDVSGYYLVRKGEFAYNKSTSSDAPWGAIKRLDRYESGVLSTLYIVFRILDEEKIDSDYLVTYYDTDLWHKGVQAIAAEGARNHGLLNIAPADFFETTVSMPQDIEEQRKIGTYFKNLDCLITLHQRELKKLQMIKKSMLRSMFV